jgi:23S rRNA (uracil1939-C5)-methyltransferase
MTDPVLLTIDHIGGKGDGVALHDGNPVYVPRAAAGDKVHAVITRNKDTLQGQIKDVVEPGPGRIAAPCPHYNECGGCQVQHLDSVTYQAWKEESVRRQFEKADLMPAEWLAPVFIPAATRRRVTLAALKKGKDLIVGFNEARSSRIVNLSTCLLLTPSLDVMRSRLEPFLHRLLPEGKITDIMLQDIDGAIELILTGDYGKLSLQKMSVISEMGSTLGLARIGWRASSFSPSEALLQLQPIRKQFGNLTIDIPSGAFLQPSREGEAALVNAVMQGCAGLKSKRIADLFSGCGTFAGHLLAHGTVYAAESEPAAVAALKKTASSMPQKLNVEKRDLVREPMTAMELKKFDCVVFDPPRAGAKEQSAQLAKSGVSRVIGVSCNPSTFIRDASILKQGGYALKSVQLIDQFIWSAHSEIVGVFTK